MLWIISISASKAFVSRSMVDPLENLMNVPAVIVGDSMASRIFCDPSQRHVAGETPRVVWQGVIAGDGADDRWAAKMAYEC